MKRTFLIVSCLLLWSLPAANAHAGTWSWHSDFIQKFLEHVQEEKDISQNATRGAPLDRDTKVKQNASQHTRSASHHTSGVAR